MALPLKELEIRVNVNDYRPLRQYDVAHAFSTGFSWLMISSSLMHDRFGVDKQVVGDFEGIDMRDYIRGFVVTSTRLMRENLAVFFGKSELDKRDVANAAGFVASLRLLDEALSTRRDSLAGSELVELMNGELGLTGEDRAGNLLVWSQTQLQRVDEHVRSRVKDRKLFNAYDRLANALEMNLSNQLRAD
jgi:hypothetical protein